VTQQEAPVEITPDLNDEDVLADELPALRWLAVAKELLAKGEVRLAMRALYFAALTHLAERNLLTIARSKSNREYETELKRRAHAFPDLIHCFCGNVTILERVWYGMHEIRRDMVHQFLANHKRIMSDVQDR
jgi:hypothetical protein